MPNITQQIVRKTMLMLVISLTMLLCSERVFAEDPRLIIWDHFDADPPLQYFMNAVSKAFTQASGIEVAVVSLPKPELIEKLVFALDTPEPDITVVDLGFIHPRIARSLTDLSSLTLASPTAPGWHLGAIGAYENIFMPFIGYSTAIYYHKDVFAQAQITLPHDRPLTQHEFLALIRQLKAAGITPIGEGASDRNNRFGIPVINTIFRFLGPQKMEQLYRREIDFSDPGVVAALTFWQQVVAAQAYDLPKVFEFGMSDGIFEVLDGKAALGFWGTWVYNKFGGTARDRGQLGVLDWFTVENGAGNGFYELTWGSGLGINRHSRYPNEAQRFLEFLSTPLAIALWAQHVQQPYFVIGETSFPDSLYETLARQRTDQQAMYQSLSHQLFWSTAATNMWNTEMQAFISGERTVQQLIGRLNSRLE